MTWEIGWIPEGWVPGSELYFKFHIGGYGSLWQSFNVAYSYERGPVCNHTACIIFNMHDGSELVRMMAWMAWFQDLPKRRKPREFYWPRPAINKIRSPDLTSQIQPIKQENRIDFLSTNAICVIEKK
jgi:hypothetical protein